MNLLDKCKAIAEDIYNDLGSGFDEPIYQKAFEVALRLNRIPYENQRIVPVFYQGYNIGEQKLDLVLNYNDSRVIGEIKAIKEDISPKEETQLTKYMRLLNIPQGFIVNFKQAGRKGVPDEPEFKVLPKPIKEEIVNG